MSKFDTILAKIAFFSACTAILLGPWLFGSWEIWFFWPMAALLFLSTCCFALRLFSGRTIEPIEDPKRKKQVTILLISIAPFLLYTLFRMLSTQVHMDAERSALLFFLPFLLAVQILFGFSAVDRKLLYIMILIDLLLLGSYGIANHFITQNKYVLYLEGYPQYVVDNRATGTYFCPDHFAGIMELAFCLGLAVLLTRKIELKLKLFPALLVLMGLAGVILSKSRGGGITIVVITIAALIWGLSMYRGITKLYYRSTAFVFMILLVLLLGAIETPYMTRFKSYFVSPSMQGKPLIEKTNILTAKLRRTSRGHMWTGAYKAWKTAPWLGIGPGMHQNLWPHFDNSQDGDRENYKWPTLQYKGTISYEAHNDWLQLLEEYGLVGMLLFLLPFSVVFWLLLNSRKCDHAVALGGLLSFICMTVHSLGDFNLQLPATGWMLASIIAIPIATLLHHPSTENLDNE